MALSLRGIAKPREGVTLIELIVVLAIIGTVALLTGLAMRRNETTPDFPGLVSLIQVARRDALRLRRPVQISLEIDGVPHVLTALPDGRVLGARVNGDSITVRREDS